MFLNAHLYLRVGVDSVVVSDSKGSYKGLCRGLVPYMRVHSTEDQIDGVYVQDKMASMETEAMKRKKGKGMLMENSNESVDR